ncbi:MAG TPA: MFS transporter [Candidatus Saccharimonadales bacterium]|nr:MFS transporter [Candidatus Saccharimonadales bacterium]
MTTSRPAATTIPSGGRLARYPLLRPLRSRDFRFLWIGQGVSLLGDQFHMVALAWLVLGLTGSGLALGLVLVASAIPRAVLIIFGGALADRIPPRTLLLVSDIARGLTVGALTALILTGRVEVWHLVVMGVLFGIVDALFFPALNTIVPSLVENDRLEAANAIVQGTTQLTGLIGPAVAGVLVAAVGTGAAFAIDTLSFGIAAVCIASIRPVARVGTGGASTTDPAGPAEPVARPSILAEIKAGFRYAASDSAIATLLVLSAALNLAFNGPIAVGLPWLASERFGGDAALFGVMIAGFGGGALIGAIAAGSLPRPTRQGRLLLAIALGLGIGIAAIGFAPSPVIVIALLAAMGLAIGYVNVIVIAWLQGRIDPEMRGRVMGLVMFASFGLAPISLAVAGVLVDVAATAMFVAAGAIVLAAVGVGLLSGAARRLDLPA